MDQGEVKPTVSGKDTKVFLYQEGEWKDVSRLIDIDKLLERVFRSELVKISVPDKRIFVVYENSKKEVSKRELTVKAIEVQKEDGKMIPIYLSAFCHLRARIRTFSVDHIHSASDADTGEVITDIGNYLLTDV